MSINLVTPNEWQKIDEETGLIMPWLTASALEYLKTIDLSDKIVWEWGLGSSSVFWSRKCKQLYGVDSNADYVQAVKNATDHAAVVWFEEGERYIHKPLELDFKFDIMVIDGIHREECVPIALSQTRKGGVIIFDNFMQPSVSCQSKYTQELLQSHEHIIYKQEGHDDWQTLIVFL